MPLDGFDRKILAALQEKGDTGPADLAPIVGLSASQISRRLQQLRKDGVLRAIRASLSPEALNIGIGAYVMLTMTSTDPGAAQAFRDQICAMDEILECQMLTGSPDMILKLATRDLASLNDLLSNHLLAAPEVATARTSIILQEVKSTSAQPLRFV
ncbi:Lrp/AsnC family transcriptional regulator [Novosphingobium olei]|uniref:Lrp/AsnC family transcriptional regulator n=1 Tax=Novosphingobium olei TaxID=2728851 RepID=UPI00308F8E0A|nr:Lrp/AsnC family transcriptional regulator [Novosphingobium olei]